MFQGELLTKRLPDGRRELLEPLAWNDGVIRIVVPRGFQTDFSSIPRVARLAMPRWSALDLPGLFHDYLYAVGHPRGLSDAFWRFLVKWCGDQAVEAEKKIHDDLASNGGPKPSRWARIWAATKRAGRRTQAGIGWVGLRIGGWVAYRGHAKKRAQAAALSS